MTSHELARKLLELPDAEVWKEADHHGYEPSWGDPEFWTADEAYQYLDDPPGNEIVMIY